MEERRRSPRVRVAGTAIALVGGRYVGAYLLRNLSAGGAYLVGDNNLALGQTVQLLLRVGEHLQNLEAEVVRQDQLPSNERSFAVAFRNLGVEVTEWLQNLASLAQDDEPAGKASTILVLGPTSPVLEALDRDVRLLGYQVATAATPLDAISLLSVDIHRIAAVVLICEHADSDPLGFLNFMKETYPQIHRVALSGALRSAGCEKAITSGVVQSLLAEPWDRGALSQALAPSGAR
jgi:ActR/RegA family two-component response regulator